MSENIFQVQSIENDIKYHEEKIEKIKAVAAKEIAWQLGSSMRLQAKCHIV